MRHKKLLSLLLALIMIMPIIPAVALADEYAAPFPVVSVGTRYDISDSLTLYDEFDYSDPQHITDELLFGEWDEENECWIPQYNSEVIKNNLQKYYPEMAEKPLINYDYYVKDGEITNYEFHRMLKAVEEAVKTCGGNYDKPKALLLQYYREKFVGFNLEITPTNSTSATLSCSALAYNYFGGSNIRMFDMNPEDTTYQIDVKSNVSSVVSSLSTSELALVISAMEVDQKASYIYSTESDYKPCIILSLSDGSTTAVYPDYDLTIAGGQYASQNFPDDIVLTASERHNADAQHDGYSAKSILHFDFSFVPDGLTVTGATLQFSGYTDKEDGKKKMMLGTESEINLVEQDEVTWTKFNNLGTAYNTFPGEMVTQYGFSGLGNSDTLAKRYLYNYDEIYAYHAIRFLVSAHIEFDGEPFIFGSNTSPRLAQCGTAKLLASSTYALINSDYMTPEAFGMLLKSVYHQAEYLVEGWEGGLLTNNHATYYNQGFSGLVTLFPEFDKADDPIIYLTDPDENFYEGGKGGWIACLQRRVLVKVRDLAAADFSGKEASLGYSREAFRNAASVMQNASATHMEELLPDEYYDKMAQAALYFVYGTAPGYYDWNTGDCYGVTANFIHGRPTIKATIDALKVILEQMPDKESDYYMQRLEWYNHLTYAWESGKAGEMPEFESILYPFTRNLVLRDGWSTKSVGATMINNNGNVHGHFDDLNIVVRAYGAQLLDDSGKPLYTRNDPTRAWQLSTRGHNTIEINDTTQRGYMSNNWEVVKGPWGENIILPFRDNHGVSNSEITTVNGIEKPENAHIKEMVDNRNYSEANLTAIYDMDDRFAIEENSSKPYNNLQGRFLEAELTDSYDYSKAETYSNINVEYKDDGNVLGNGSKEYKALDNAHNRSLLFIKTQAAPHFFIVTDYVAPINGNTEVNKYAQGWHFSDTAKITIDPETKETRTGFNGANIAVVPIIGTDTETIAEKKVGLYTSGDHIPADYVTYTKYSDKPTTFNTILFPMDAGQNHKIETALISVDGMEEADASAFKFTITDPDTGKVTNGTYYNMHHLDKKTDVNLGDYLFDGRMLYVDNHDGIYTAAIVADGTYVQTSDEDYLIKSTSNMSNISVEWRGDGIYIETTHTDENEAEYLDLSSLTILNQRNTRKVYLNGKSIPYKISGSYIYFGDTAVLEDVVVDGIIQGTVTEEQKPDNNHSTGSGGGGASGGSTPSDNSGIPQINPEAAPEDTTGTKPEVVPGTKVELSDGFKAELESHWGKDEITALVEAGVVNGVSEESLGLTQEVTRAQFAAMLVRALGLDTVKYNGEFGDVNTGDWYADVLATVKAAGIMDGDTQGNVNPNDVLTREQMAKMAVSALDKVKGIKATSLPELDLADKNSISPWATDYVKASISLGIMKGVSDDTFAPLNTVPREQAMVLVYRLMNK